MEWIFILVLILLNGFFSMSEIALVSSRRVRLESAVKAGKAGAQTALDLSLHPNRFLSTVQIGITLIGLLTGIYSGETFTDALEVWLGQNHALQPVADELAVAIVLLVITFATLVLGELVPKQIGLSNPERISRAVAPAMKFVSYAALPFVWILSKTSEIIMAVLKIKPRKEQVTEEEIKAVIQEATRGGEVQTIERDIVERVFALGDRSIASVMTTRNDLVYLNIQDDFQKIVGVIKSDLHRVYPVMDGDKDRLLGAILLKDVFTSVANGDLDLRRHLKRAHFLNENTSAYKALENFKSAGTHYAFVSDEYGLIMGIVTLDDILQALVGDVYDPENRQAQLLKRKDGTWLADGEYPLVEFAIYFDVELPEEVENVNTIAGLILKQLDHIPRVGEKVLWHGFEFEVVDLDGIKIDKVLLCKV